MLVFLGACDRPEIGTYGLTVENRTDETIILSIAGDAGTEIQPLDTVELIDMYLPWDERIEFVVRTLDGEVLYQRFMSIN